MLFYYFCIRFKLQIRSTFKNGGRGSAFNEFTTTDSRYIFAKEKEFRFEDALNVSADAENATECCNTGSQGQNNIHKHCCLRVMRELILHADAVK